MDERAVPEPLRVGYQARIHSIKSGKHSGDKNRQRIHEHPYPDLAPRTPRGALKVTPKMREEIGRTLCHCLKEIGYQNAGTVEFLMDEDGQLHFIEVDALRHELGLPGMKVVQFGFGDKGAHIHLPHRYTPDTVAYTGTHDNNTTLGWWQAAGKAEHAAIEAYVGPVGKQPVWPLIWAIEASVAQMAVVPAQDLLELGAEARMNTPALAAGNWSWRAPETSWTPELAARLAALSEATDRDNDPLAEAKK